LQAIHERLSQLEAIVKAENANLGNLGQRKLAIQEEIAESERVIAELRDELKDFQETLDEKTKVLDQVKRTTAKSSKVLDQALKEIASKVGRSFSAVAIFSDIMLRMTTSKDLLRKDHQYTESVV
jgi:structural maintenance of chromosome 1